MINKEEREILEKVYQRNPNLRMDWLNLSWIEKDLLYAIRLTKEKYQDEQREKQ